MRHCFRHILLLGITHFYFCWCIWQFDVGGNQHDTWANDCILLSFIVFWRLPFYYELKIAFVVWLLSPYTKGSSVLYRKFVHPTLSSKEKVLYLTWFVHCSFLFFSFTLSRLKKNIQRHYRTFTNTFNI